MSIKCKICNSDNLTLLFNGLILGKYNSEYYQCNECAFCFPTNINWLDEAYNNALNIEDTGVLKRNIMFSNRLIPFFYFGFKKNSKFVDWGGGYGVFTRLMRDIGFNFYWSDKFATNMLSRGFEYDNLEKVDAITTFEVFEHLEHPLDEIMEMFKITDTIVFSTELINFPAPHKTNWAYYAFEHGQHIAFYNKKTFDYLSNKLNLFYYSNGINLHILSKKPFNKFLTKLTLKYSKYFYFIIKPLLNSKTNEDSKNLKRY